MSDKGVSAGADRDAGGSEMARRLGSHDWSATGLGPIEGWPQSLRTTVDLILRSPVPIVLLWGADGIMIYNDAYSVFAGGRHPQLFGSKVREGWPEVAAFNDNVMRVGLAGGILAYRDQELTLHRSGRPEQVWMNLDYSPVIDESGKPGGVVAIVVETTQRVMVEAALREETQALEILNRAGEAIAAELDLERVVQMVTDAGVEITGARFGAFFYNVLDSAGERYMLYTLSGVPREAFARFPMPRNTAVFGATFSGEGIVRSDDITEDPRYGSNAPNRGMPEGHLPVRSYLAVPVASRSGEVIGGLFFGHPERARFTARHERLLQGIAGQAATAIDNARLFGSAQQELEQRRLAQARLRDLNETLERRVADALAEREEVEAVLRQAQKMEAIGHLTGGIAHDFNNILAVVLGSLDLVERRGGTVDPRAKRYLDAAMEGARRGAQLTQRLLAFSRQQPLRPEPFDPNRLVRDMSDLLRRSLGSAIRIETVLAAGLWRVQIDPNQLESAILNLAVNARDAMPDGGRLTIETQNAHLDDRYVAGHFGVAAGQYVLIAVTDTGAGMAPEILAKAFDPFFTTKEVGKGTGLGLSQVYGFVKQSGGHVKIYSEPGQGTTVKIYLPRLHWQTDDLGDAAETERALGDLQESVLVVEDDANVRQFSVNALSELGYRVLEADGAAAALRLLDTYPEIVLLFTDIVMPDVNGRQLADEALRRRPELKVLFTTGYTRNAVVTNGILDQGVELISKPFSVEDLATKVRAVLNGNSDPRPQSP